MEDFLLRFQGSLPQNVSQHFIILTIILTCYELDVYIKDILYYKGNKSSEVVLENINNIIEHFDYSKSI